MGAQCGVQGRCPCEPEGLPPFGGLICNPKQIPQALRAKGAQCGVQGRCPCEPEGLPPFGGLICKSQTDNPKPCAPMARSVGCRGNAPAGKVF